MESQEQQNDERQHNEQQPPDNPPPEEQKIPEQMNLQDLMNNLPQPTWENDGLTPVIADRGVKLLHARNQQLKRWGYDKTVCDLAMLNALWRPDGLPSRRCGHGPEKLDQLVHSLQGQLPDDDIQHKDVAFVNSPQFVDTTSNLYNYLWADALYFEWPQDIFLQAAYKPIAATVP